MADVWISEFVADLVPPFVTGTNPAGGSTNVARSANIALTVDDDIGVVLTSILIEVNRGAGFEPAYNGSGGGFQTGFTGPGSQVTVSGSGFGFDFIIDPNALLPEFQVVTVRVTGQDGGGNPVTPNPTTYSFQTEDTTLPAISLESPTPTANDPGFVDDVISFRLTDTGCGVDTSTLNVTVDNGGSVENAIIAGVFQAPYNGGLSAITPFGPDSFDVVIDRTSDLAIDSTIVVSGSVSDCSVPANTLNFSWQFTTNLPVVEPVVIPDLPLDMYRFLIWEIRRMDLFGSPRPGSLFLRRYFDGLQEVWEELIFHIRDLPTLWNVTEIQSRLLTYMKWIVGWTDEPFLKKITDAIDDDSLRRLIAASGGLWATRGPEDTILNALSIITGGARARIWNWFDFRWVLDETELGEEHEGRDPWVISLPSVVESSFTIDSGIKSFSTDGGVTIRLNFGSFSFSVTKDHVFRLTSGTQNGKEAPILTRVSATEITLQGIGIGASFGESDWEIVDQTFEADDEYRSNLRIVDDGTLDRALVKRVLRLMRASGERWGITYLAFLDLFQVDGDFTQWEPLPSGNITVASSRMQLNDTSQAEETFAIGSFMTNLKQYTFAARLRGQSGAAAARFYALFYYSDAANHYRVAIDTVSKELKIQRVLATVVSDLATLDLNLALIDLLANTYYTIRVVIVDELPNHRISVFVDGSELLSVVTTKDITKGTIGFRHEANASIEIDEAEVFVLPVDRDDLTINELP